MAASERVTVTLPVDVVRDIDQMVKNRSRFVLEAVRRELARRRRAALRQSLRHPHPEGEQLAEAGFDQWADSLPAEEAADLVELDAGVAVRWVVGRGWIEEDA